MNAKSSLILGLSLIIGLTALGYVAGEAALSVKSRERTVTVKGLSEREVSATVAAWPVSFQVAANDLNEVYATVESQSAIVRRYLVDNGLAEADITPSPPAVVDLYAQSWGDKSSIPFRYTANASVTVFTENVEAVRRAMSNLVDLGKQGVAVSQNPEYGDSSNVFLYTQLSDVKPAMVEEATRNARGVAEKFAADSDSRLGKIKSASQGQFSISDRDSTTPYIKKVRVVSTIEYYLAD